MIIICFNMLWASNNLILEFFPRSVICIENYFLCYCSVQNTFHGFPARHILLKVWAPKTFPLVGRGVG